MRYRLLFFTIALFSCVVCFISCSETDSAINERTGQLRLAPSIAELMETKASANNFFEEGDEIKVTIQSSTGAEQTLTYVYGADGIFNGDPDGYHFPLDDSYITSLTAVWPEDAPASGAFEADQREYENYRRADWLVASASASGIMATDIPVPLFFEHNNCLLEFELVGQNTNGLIISELLIELEVDGEPTACWAYCGNADGRASFLLKDGTMLSSQEGYLIGTIPGNAGDRYTIILPEIDLRLEAGKRYLVTLTPRGYDMEMYVLIGTFTTPTGERDTGIAVPFHLPDQGENGDYIIRTPVQLVTVSYVIRHYTDDRTPDFRSSTYVLSDDFVMSAEMAAEYIPIPLSLFTGQIVQNGVAIDSLPYGDDQVLELYTND